MAAVFLDPTLRTLKEPTRRSFLAGLMLAPAACAAPPSGPSANIPAGPIYAAAGTPYGPITDGQYEIDALDLNQRSLELDRQLVAFNKGHPPRTIVINIAERRLYLTQQGGMALRYAVGVGRSEAINFKGNAIIGRKAEWPHCQYDSGQARICRLSKWHAGGIGKSTGSASALSLSRWAGHKFPPAWDDGT